MAHKTWCVLQLYVYTCFRSKTHCESLGKVILKKQLACLKLSVTHAAQITDQVTFPSGMLQASNHFCGRSRVRRR